MIAEVHLLKTNYKGTCDDASMANTAQSGVVCPFAEYGINGGICDSELRAVESFEVYLQRAITDS